MFHKPIDRDWLQVPTAQLGRLHLLETALQRQSGVIAVACDNKHGIVEVMSEVCSMVCLTQLCYEDITILAEFTGVVPAFGDPRGLLHCRLNMTLHWESLGSSLV